MTKLITPLVRASLEGILFAVVLVGWGKANQTTRLSVDSQGNQGNAYSASPSPSKYASHVAFASYADNLVSGDTNNASDIFLHNRITSQVGRVSVDSSGQEGNGHSWWPSIALNGGLVVFESEASDLVIGDTNSVGDVFVHDPSTGQTDRVSVDSNGNEGNGPSGQPAISADGRYVAFASDASNLAIGDLNNSKDIFVHDLLNGHTARVSVNSGGTEGNANSAIPSISAGGRCVAFESGASNLVLGDTNQTYDVFVHDIKTGKTTRVSVATAGQQGNDASISASISSDGRLVAFASYAENLVSGDANQDIDVFVHDRLTGQTTRVSVSSSGKEGNQDSWSPSISHDARYVAFASLANNLVAGDTNQAIDVFVHDRGTGKTTRLSLDSGGNEANNDSGLPSISPDGLSVSFQSLADNLVPGDTNGFQDVFLNSQVCSPISTYCAASASSIPGCQASISAIGVPSLASPLLFGIMSGNVPGGNLGVCLFGGNGQASIPFGTLGGQLCVNPPVLRTTPKPGGGQSGVCNGMISFTLQDLIDASTIVVAGAALDVEIWARDPSNPDGFLLSDGLEFGVCP